VRAFLLVLSWQSSIARHLNSSRRLYNVFGLEIGLAMHSEHYDYIDERLV